jgi:undecaprenyl-diphosphatase
MTFLQAIVIGVIQGIAELFPISSLAQTILIPSLIGGSWGNLVSQVASPESPYLAFVVGLHVACAAALILFFWREWLAIIGGFFTSLVRRRVETPDERLAWLIVIATIPVGILGLLFEHQIRVLFAKPFAAAMFLTVNGVLLLGGEWLFRRNAKRRAAEATAAATDEQLAATPAGEQVATRVDADTARTIRVVDAIWIGVAQSSALLAGISRDGVCIVAGLSRGLSREAAARFAFLLSAPPIMAAGLYKLPDLFGPLGNGIRPQILVGSIAAFATAYLATRFLVRYFRFGNLIPFAAFCLIFGAACMVRFGLF